MEVRQVQLSGVGSEAEFSKTEDGGSLANLRPTNLPKKMVTWWLLVALFAFFILAGQSAATLLGRLYFDKGGNSNWMGALVQNCGFPILIPLYFLSLDKKNTTTTNINTKSPSTLVLASVYITFGVFIALTCILFAVGLACLPVSTYSLLCATQLGFNALFAYYINSQKFTPYIVNSLFLLTLSSVLLVFEGNDDTKAAKVTKSKYAIGFICTLAASAGYGLSLSLTQFSFKRILKSETFRGVTDMVFFPSIVSSVVLFVGLFSSGEWKGIGKEMEGFALGKASYLMTLIGTAVSWQIYYIGSVGLIFIVSSLFSNVIATLGLPVVPVLAVFVFQEKMDGIKAVAMVLAIWGFVSNAYQHYYGGFESEAEQKSNADDNDVPKPLEVSV